MNLDEAVLAYNRLRAKIAEIETANKAALQPYYATQQKLEAFFLDHCNTHNLKHVATEHGTIVRGTTVSVSVENWDDVLNFVQTNGAWHMLNKSVSKAAVDEYLEETKQLPPGVKRSSAYKVTIRKKG